MSVFMVVQVFLIGTDTEDKLVYIHPQDLLILHNMVIGIGCGVHGNYGFGIVFDKIDTLGNLLGYKHAKPQPAYGNLHRILVGLPFDYIFQRFLQGLILLLD